MKKQDTYNIELTDTRDGEANYAWVRRYQITVAKGASDLTVLRRAKKEVGWTGERCITHAYDSSFTVIPKKVCQIMFVDRAEEAR
jgi:hypothetical protein